MSHFCFACDEFSVISVMVIAVFACIFCPLYLGIYSADYNHAVFGNFGDRVLNFKKDNALL